MDKKAIKGFGDSLRTPGDPGLSRGIFPLIFGGFASYLDPVDTISTTLVLT